ncbi:MAG: sulfatase [Candidatus Omnitrophica bacterium]|nr:sulfatase [Candidatus Omnitrophota bacterium]
MRKNTISVVLVLLLSIVILFILITFDVFDVKRKEKYIVKKPNILLITVCSLRQDHLSIYGYPRLTSPNIDKLAETSTLFKNSYTHIPWTKPSTIALMTGKHPSLFTNNGETLSELLQTAGYFTSGIIGTNMVHKAAKMDVGFDVFLDNRDLKTGQDHATVQADIIAERAKEFLSQEQIKRSPVFLWLFFKDPHWKYLPPLPYKHKFLNDLLYSQQFQQLVINKDLNDSIKGIGRARLKDPNGEFITNKAYYISQYDAEIFFMDTQLGKIINYLKETGRFDDWMIILVADHGESLGGDDYFFNHGYKLSQGLIKIPLIVKFPGQKRAKVRDDLVSIRDIYPTVVEVLGMTRDAKEGVGADIYGQSLLLKKGDWLKIFKRNPRKIALENSWGHENEHTRSLGCIWDSYKLIWNQTTNEKKLYSLLGQETLVERYNSSQQKLINDMSEFILNFFSNRDVAQSNNIDELRSLGYLQ